MCMFYLCARFEELLNLNAVLRTHILQRPIFVISVQKSWLKHCRRHDTFVQLNLLYVLLWNAKLASSQTAVSITSSA